jgi:hypothetical protein
LALNFVAPAIAMRHGIALASFLALLIVSCAMAGEMNGPMSKRILNRASVMCTPTTASWTSRSVAAGLRRTDEAMIDAINAALDRMIASGTLAQFYAKYGVDYRQP